jgi:hypothetical protein
MYVVDEFPSSASKYDIPLYVCVCFPQKFYKLYFLLRSVVGMANRIFPNYHHNYSRGRGPLFVAAMRRQTFTQNMALSLWRAERWLDRDGE